MKTIFIAFIALLSGCESILQDKQLQEDIIKTGEDVIQDAEKVAVDILQDGVESCSSEKKP